jgi:adenylosuccinate lyase
MIADISGSQWNEGDVSCSAVRRVTLPDAFYATDAILEIAIKLVDKVEFNGKLIDSEIELHTPEICSSSLLMLAIKKGVGREVAHKAVKEHALASKGGSNFFDLVIGDPVLTIEKSEIDKLKSNLRLLSGEAPSQAKSIASNIKHRLLGKVDMANFQPSKLR